MKATRRRRRSEVKRGHATHFIRHFDVASSLTIPFEDQLRDGDLTAVWPAKVVKISPMSWEAACYRHGLLRSGWVEQ